MSRWRFKKDWDFDGPDRLLTVHDLDLLPGDEPALLAEIAGRLAAVEAERDARVAADALEAETRAASIASLGITPGFGAGLLAAVAAKAPLASPSLTGNPTVDGVSIEDVAGSQAKATAAQAAAIQRGNHTGVQPSTTISDFTEAVQDAVAVLLGAGSNVTVSYNDAANTLTVSSPGSQDAEAVRDTLGIALVGLGNISVTVNDALDTLTISTTATTNATDSVLLARGNHTGTQLAATVSDFAAAADARVAAAITGKANLASPTFTGSVGGITAAMVGLGSVNNTSDAAKPLSTAAVAESTVAKTRANHIGTQSADTVIDGTMNKAFLSTERTKLSGVAAGSTSNSPDATLLARGNHTGSQSADTVTDGTTNKAFLSTERSKLDGIAAGATANAPDATLLARGSHTGTQSADTILDGTTNHVFTVADDTKLAGVAAGATLNSTDVSLIARANHTGTQPVATITGLGTAATVNTGVASGNVPLLGASGTLAVARLATGVPDGTKFVKDDGTLAIPANAGGPPTGPAGGSLAGDYPNPQLALSGMRNRILNGDFRINQSAYVSGTVAGAGVYTFDQWKSTIAGTALTFVAQPAGQLVTLNASKQIAQVIERANMPAGRYVINYAGDAAVRCYNVGATPPGFVSGPLVVDLDGLADVTVEFQAWGAVPRTIGLVQFEQIAATGTVADVTPFERRPVGWELELCQRYFERVVRSVGRYGVGVQWAAGNFVGVYPFKVTKRAVPTVSFSAASTFSILTTANNVPTTVAIDSATTEEVAVGFTVAGTPGSAGLWYASAGSFMDISARL